MENVEQIAAVPGFDGLLFGPGDFSHLIGRAGQVNHPDVVAARRRVGAAAQANGKFAMSAGMFAPRSVLESEGYRVFNLGADVLGMGNYFCAKVAEFGPA